LPVLLDTGILYAYYDRSDAWHSRAVKLIRGETGGLIVPTPVLPEVDHLVGNRLGQRARLLFYEGLLDGHYFPVDLPRDRYTRVRELNRQFADLELGFVDAAVVALAEALELPRIATADRRHFEPMAAKLGLELLP
jgi:predicted nucleic acid-binding protein